MISQIYIEAYMGDCLLKLVMGINGMMFILIYVFDEEIVLMNNHPRYTEYETAFRVHQRCFIRSYDSNQCHRRIRWEK